MFYLYLHGSIVWKKTPVKRSYLIKRKYGKQDRDTVSQRRTTLPGDGELAPPRLVLGEIVHVNPWCGRTHPYRLAPRQHLDGLERGRAKDRVREREWLGLENANIHEIGELMVIILDSRRVLHPAAGTQGAGTQGAGVQNTWNAGYWGTKHISKRSYGRHFEKGSAVVMCVLLTPHTCTGVHGAVVKPWGDAVQPGVSSRAS